MAGGPSDSQAVAVAKPGGAAAQGGPFHRRPADKRLVKQVLSPQRTPTHWVPMDVNSTECKLMEVRKYSAEYHEIDSKFRKPHLELITAYAVQNPFLFGCYDLRREQIKMQLTAYSKTRPEASLKEKFFFYPTTFSNLEMILRNNFSAVNNIDDDDQTDQCKHHVKFYTSSVLANEAFKGMGNPRVMLVARVAIVLCHHLHEETRGASSRPQPCPFASTNMVNQRNSDMVADTLANVDKTLFYKFNANEMYPDHVLIYRDLDGPNDDRSSRLVNDLQHCYISYRAGTRYNPDEREYKGKKHREDEAAAAAAAAVLTSTSPVGYHNAQTSIQIESEPPKKLSKANLQDEDDNSADKVSKANDESADVDQGKGKEKKKKFSLISILNFKSSNEENENEAKRKHKKSFKGNPPRSLREEQEMEESMPLKSISDNKSNINVVTSSNDEDRIEEASKETGAIPKRQSSKKIK